MLMRQLFLLFEKSNTFWDNPRMCLAKGHKIVTQARLEL